MGCMGSKAGADVSPADVYRLPPTSVALFDVTAVDEPWLRSAPAADADTDADAKKPPSTVVPLPLLDKLDSYDLPPTSWHEVSKALEDLRPSLTSKPSPTPPPKNTSPEQPQPPSLRAADDLDMAGGKKQPSVTSAPPAKNSSPEQPKPPLPPPPSVRDVGEPDTAGGTKPPPPELTGRRVVKENPFLQRDRECKGKEAAAAVRWRRRDPFEGCPERRPPGAGGGGVVLYTTTLRGVRRTFEDCERARRAVEAAAAEAGGAAVDERDVSLHGDYRRELRELAGEGAAVPRLFVMGRYVGGADEAVALAEDGRLREMVRWAKARGEAAAGSGGRGCEGCGGARFVPCWECGGSCRVVAAAQAGGGAAEAGQKVERCGKCNENGLMMCPLCH